MIDYTSILLVMGIRNPHPFAGWRGGSTLLIWIKSKKSFEKRTKCEPPLDGMRCAIVALITFLVVVAFNPERELYLTLCKS
jgi:hypothetical protein